MKNRRLFISVFLLISLLFLGIGYAALTNKLAINGSIDAVKNNDNLKVEFVGNTTSAKEDEVGTESTAFTVTTIQSGQNATITINGISKIGQNAVVIYKVQNNSSNVEALTASLDTEFDISLGVGTVNGSKYTVTEGSADYNNDANIFLGEHFEIKVEYLEENDATGTITRGAGGEVQNVMLKSGEFVYIKVTIKLINPVEEDVFPKHVFTIRFNATTMDPVQLPIE